MQQPIPWIWYQSELGAETVKKELSKLGLSTEDQMKMVRTLNRSSLGESMPGDIDYLGDGLLEVRVRLPSRQLRLLYFIALQPERQVIVFAGIKKTQKTPRQWLVIAKNRRKSWLA